MRLAGPPAHLNRAERVAQAIAELKAFPDTVEYHGIQAGAFYSLRWRPSAAARLRGAKTAGGVLVFTVDWHLYLEITRRVLKFHKGVTAFQQESTAKPQTSKPLRKPVPKSEPEPLWKS